LLDLVGTSKRVANGVLREQLICHAFGLIIANLAYEKSAPASLSPTARCARRASTAYPRCSKADGQISQLISYLLCESVVPVMAEGAFQ